MLCIWLLLIRGLVATMALHLLAGNLERLQTALELSGTDPLAALQANTYRLPSALSTERHWNEALQRSSCQMAKHPTSSYAYFNVTRAGV